MVWRTRPVTVRLTPCSYRTPSRSGSRRTLPNLKWYIYSVIPECWPLPRAFLYSASSVRRLFEQFFTLSHIISVSGGVAYGGQHILWYPFTPMGTVIIHVHSIRRVHTLSAPVWVVAIFVTVTFGASQIVSSLSHNVSPTNQHSSLGSFSFRNCQGSSRLLRSDARPVPAYLRSWGIGTCRRRVVVEMAVSTLPSSLMTLVMVVEHHYYLPHL